MELTKSNIEILNHEGSTNIEDPDEDDQGESADVFADLGSDILPWNRQSTGSSNENSTFRHRMTLSNLDKKKMERDINMYKEISNMTKSIYDSFSVRETMLKSSYSNTRFFMIENFIQTEMLKYEMLVKEMRENSVSKSMDEIDVRLEYSKYDITVNLDDMRDRKIYEIKTAWLLKIQKSAEDFHNKTNLVRSMFRRTNHFFNELNEFEYEYTTKKHLREISKQNTLHKLRMHSEPFIERVNDIEIAHQKEIQSIQFRNIKEVYVRLIQKEWSALDIHLTMLEDLYNKLYRIYVKTMNLKIKHVREWHKLRKKQEHYIQDKIRNIHDVCNTDFQNYKDSERRTEIDEIKKNSELDREKRFRNFEDSEMVVSSELVFNMTMKKNKHLYIYEDTSSEGSTFDGDIPAADFPDLELNEKNSEFLKLVRKRVQIKAVLEKKYNDLLSTEITQMKENEKEMVDANRKVECDFLKKEMENYFKFEKSFENKIQTFLQKEKRAIDELKSKHENELISITQTHEIDLERVKSSERKSAMNKEPNYQRLQKHEDTSETLITAHVFHEIRNVLASILCLGENLKENSESIDQIVGEQNDICNYALGTMNDMLDIAKIKNMKQIKKSRISIDQLFDTVIKLQGVRAKAGVVVTKLIKTERFIYGNNKLLLQLFINLMSNATKFTQVGSILLYASIYKKDNVDFIKVGICDTGIGISIERKKTINDSSSKDHTTAFVETHSEISSEIMDYKNSGYNIRNTGYGLYLAATAADALGCKLKVVSPVSEAKNKDFPLIHETPGSFFYIILPIAGDIEDYRVEERTARDISALSDSVDYSNFKFRPSGCMKVLIVDDQKLLRQTMMFVFKSLAEIYPNLEVHIDTACSAEEALRKQSKSRYDIITIDQYFDQTMISRNVIVRNQEESTYTHLVFENSADSNRENYNLFKNKESFDVLPSDGILLGTDVIYRLREYASSPIVISCSGSDIIDYSYCLKKPYNVKSFIRLFEDNVFHFLEDKVVRMDCKTVRKNDSLTLYDLTV